MRLHNRQVKAEFWNDPELLQWPREKRWFYLGLVQLADDSGCVENNAFAFKINLFPSPADQDITPERISSWVQELIQAGKLIPYTAQRKDCLFIKNFHKHQSLNKPTPPNKSSVPLPPWIAWQRGPTRGSSGYVINAAALPGTGTCSECAGPGPAPATAVSVLVSDVSRTCPGHVPPPPAHVPPEPEPELEPELYPSAYADGGASTKSDKQAANVVEMPRTKDTGKKGGSVSPEAKQVVQHLHEQLSSRGVNHLPRDWHLKQYSVAARIIRSGVSPGELIACVDWLFANEYWCDKVADMLAVERQFPRFKLAQGGDGSASTPTAASTQRGGTAGNVKQISSQYDSIWARAEAGS